MWAWDPELGRQLGGAEGAHSRGTVVRFLRGSSPL
jgi:hypothetical protein